MSMIDKINKVLENPVKLIIVGFPYFLILIVIMGFLYIEKISDITRNKIPAVLKDSTNIVAELTIQSPRIAEAIDKQLLKTPNDEMLSNGKQVYEASCASCHGGGGKGDGAAGVALNPKPKNFEELENWKNGSNLVGMYLTLEKGIPGGGMSAYDFMSPYDRVSIIQYIRKEITKTPKEDTDKELEDFDNLYKLSEGTEIPGQIPLAIAELKLQRNNAGNKELIETIKGLYKEHDSRDILEKYIYDISMSATYLLRDTKWKNGKEEFIKYLSIYSGSNGFNSRVFIASERDVEQLFNFFKKSI